MIKHPFIPELWKEECAMANIPPTTPSRSRETMTNDRWFCVEVRDAAGQIVCIESAALSGRDIGASEQRAIEWAIDMLSGFIGRSSEPSAPHLVPAAEQVATPEGDRGPSTKVATCEHLRSERLGSNLSAEPPFEMRKCLDCTKVFRKRLSVRT